MRALRVRVDGDATLRVTGEHPFVILAAESVTIEGTIDAGAHGIEAGAGGGGAGGTGRGMGTASANGGGLSPGRHGPASPTCCFDAGGGGGGMCGAGGNGGDTDRSWIGGRGGAGMLRSDWEGRAFSGGSGGGLGGLREGATDVRGVS